MIGIDNLSKLIDDLIIDTNKLINDKLETESLIIEAFRGKIDKKKAERSSRIGSIEDEKALDKYMGTLKPHLVFAFPYNKNILKESIYQITQDNYLNSEAVEAFFEKNLSSYPSYNNFKKQYYEKWYSKRKKEQRVFFRGKDRNKIPFSEPDEFDEKTGVEGLKGIQKPTTKTDIKRIINALTVGNISLDRFEYIMNYMLEGDSRYRKEKGESKTAASYLLPLNISASIYLSEKEREELAEDYILAYNNYNKLLLQKAPEETVNQYVRNFLKKGIVSLDSTVIPVKEISNELKEKIKQANLYNEYLDTVIKALTTKKDAYVAKLGGVEAYNEQLKVHQENKQKIGKFLEANKTSEKQANTPAETKNNIIKYNAGLAVTQFGGTIRSFTNHLQDTIRTKSSEIDKALSSGNKNLAKQLFDEMTKDRRERRSFINREVLGEVSKWFNEILKKYNPSTAKAILISTLFVDPSKKFRPEVKKNDISIDYLKSSFELPLKNDKTGKWKTTEDIEKEIGQKLQEIRTGIKDGVLYVAKDLPNKFNGKIPDNVNGFKNNYYDFYKGIIDFINHLKKNEEDITSSELFNHLQKTAELYNNERLIKEKQNITEAYQIAEPQHVSFEDLVKERSEKFIPMEERIANFKIVFNEVVKRFKQGHPEKNRSYSDYIDISKEGNLTGFQKSATGELFSEEVKESDIKEAMELNAKLKAMSDSIVDVALKGDEAKIEKGKFKRGTKTKASVGAISSKFSTGKEGSFLKLSDYYDKKYSKDLGYIASFFKQVDEIKQQVDMEKMSKEDAIENLKAIDSEIRQNNSTSAVPNKDFIISMRDINNKYAGLTGIDEEEIKRQKAYEINYLNAIGKLQYHLIRIGELIFMDCLDYYAETAGLGSFEKMRKSRDTEETNLQDKSLVVKESKQYKLTDYLKFL